VVVVLVDFVLDFDREVGVVEDVRDEGQGGRVIDRDRKTVAYLQRAVEESESHHRSHKAVMYFHIGLSAPSERGDQSELIDLMAAVRDRDADNVVVDVQLAHSETHYRMVPMTSSERIRLRQRQLQVATLFFPVDDDRNPLQDLPPNLRYQEIQASDGGAVSFDGMLLFVGERPCASIVGQI
jgi:hypothetical protein